MYAVKVTLLLVLIKECVSAFRDSECGMGNTVDISRGTHLTNGDVYFNGIKYDKSEYFMDNESGNERGCLCSKNICVRKCCPYGSGYNFKRKLCENVTDVFEPPVWDEFRLMKYANASEMFHFIFGKMNCTQPEYRIRIGQVAPHYHLRMVSRRILSVTHLLLLAL